MPFRLPARDALRLFPLALLLGLCLFAIGFWSTRSVQTPAADDYRKIGQIVRAHWADGDALTVRPWWAARIREQLGDLTFVSVRDLAGEDWSRFARLWVVLLPGAELSGPFADAGVSLQQEFVAGNLRLRRYQLAERADIRFDFRAQLHQAKVRMRRQSTAVPCDRWVENRWQCSRHDWNYVGRITVELDRDPREVIWAHPADHPLEIEFDGVPAGRELRVHTGFTPPAARAVGGTSVTLQVLVNDREIGRVVQDNQTGYFLHRWDLTGLGRGPHRVTFVVTAPHGGMRHFCFDGEVRG